MRNLQQRQFSRAKNLIFRRMNLQPVQLFRDGILFSWCWNNDLSTCVLNVCSQEPRALFESQSETKSKWVLVQLHCGRASFFRYTCTKLTGDKNSPTEIETSSLSSFGQSPSFPDFCNINQNPTVPTGTRSTNIWVSIGETANSLKQHIFRKYIYIYIYSSMEPAVIRTSNLWFELPTQWVIIEWCWLVGCTLLSTPGAATCQLTPSYPWNFFLHLHQNGAKPVWADLVQSTLLTVDTAYRGQLSTMDSQQCTLHFGAKTLLTVDNSLNCGPWTPFHGTKVHFLSLPWTVNNNFFVFVLWFSFVVFLSMWCPKGCMPHA